MITINKYKKNLINMIKKYGIRKIFFSTETIIIILAIFIVVIITPKLNIDGIDKKIDLMRSYSTICVSLSGGMLAVTVTAMSILVGMINDNFMKFIHKANAYYDFVVPFYLNALFWGIGIILNMILIVSSYLNIIFMIKYNRILLFIIGLSTGFLISSIKGTLELVYTSIRLGEYRAKVLLKEEERKHK